MSAALDLCRDLGLGAFDRGHKVAWAVRQLEHGHPLARRAWALDLEPKRLLCLIESGALVLYRTGCSKEVFAKMTWDDVTADDWYVVEQLEIVR
jgi:hypothetical protein